MRPAAVALLLAGLLLPPAAARAERWMRVALPDGGEALAEVMVTPQERARGLMHRDALAPGRLMLLHYTEDGTRRIWMKHCRFPIDVAWLDARGRVLAVARDVPPCKQDPCPQYGPDIPSRDIVEGPAGWLDAHGVRVDGRIGLGDWVDPP
jgi:uncharacterized membrane protein (UPF0127 family)